MTSVAYGESASISKRLEIIEKQLKAVQRKVFTPGSEFPQNESQALSSVPSTGGSGASLAGIEVRLSQIETEIRQLTGRIEEGNFQIDKLKQTIETMARDYEFRLKTLEKTGSASSMDEKSSFDDNISNQNRNTVAEQENLPQGSEQDQYSYAQKLVTMGQYDKAETALGEFIKRYPNSDLAGNAQYWLGQTYYVRKDYTKATRAFLEGYNNYPKSQKAPAFLLKIGMSLFAMGEKTDACDAYRELGSRFPDSSENKTKRLSEEQRAGCR